MPQIVMTMKNEIKAHLVASMKALLDPYMLDHGFSRANGSLTYKRRLNGSTQKIDIDIQIHPKDRPESAAAVYPRMEISVPAVDAILDEMVGDDLSRLEGITAGMSRQPIAFTSEKAHTGRWFIFQPDSVPVVVEGIRSFVERWTMPFLDAYSTPQDIWAADEREDGRLARDRAQTIRVVAAALACGRRDDALQRMEKSFSAPGLRRRYQRVFDYIQKVNGPR
jgi:hypothetical protein